MHPDSCDSVKFDHIRPDSHLQDERDSKGADLQFRPRRISIAPSCANLRMPLDLFHEFSLIIFAARIGICEYDFDRQQIRHG
jgi:hypothetical protein